MRKNRIRYDVKELKKIMVSLHAQGKIDRSPRLPDSWLVNIPKEEIEIEKKVSKESEVTDDKIKFIIRKLYRSNSEFPKPFDIEHEFWTEFGKPDMKDFTRHLRDMVDREVLERTEDFRYYFKGLTATEEEINLKNFIKEIAK